MLFKHDHSNTQFMIYWGLLGFSICLSNMLNDRLPNHLSKDVAFSIKWQLFSMVDEMCVKMVDLKGQTVLALSAWWRWCHPNTAVTFVELGVYLWMCLTTWGYGCVWCVRAYAAEGVAVSQGRVDGLHKEIAKGERQLTQFRCVVCTRDLFCPQGPVCSGCESCHFVASMCVGMNFSHLETNSSVLSQITFTVCHTKTNVNLFVST